MMMMMLMAMLLTFDDTVIYLGSSAHGTFTAIVAIVLPNVVCCTKAISHQRVFVCVCIHKKLHSMSKQ